MVHDISVANGIKVGTDGTVTVTALDADATMFKRRAIKNAGTPEAREECWLVTELNGVRVYQSGQEVVVTTQNLYP